MPHCADFLAACIAADRDVPAHEAAYREPLVAPSQVQGLHLEKPTGSPLPASVPTIHASRYSTTPSALKSQQMVRF
jgi:hypothetical protein